MNTPIILKEESYDIISACMEVHNNLGTGFSEIVYKDTLEYEFDKRLIPFEREKQYTVRDKEIILPHVFYADFVVFDSIILEMKCVSQFTSEFTAQCLNYLKVSGHQLALLANFGELRLRYKRTVL